MKKNSNQSELLAETPAEIKDGQPGDPKAEKLELIDDTPDVVKMDLRKFNKAKQKVNAAIANVKAITIINSKEGVDKMLLLLKEADAVAKVIEAKRKDLGDPYRLEVVRVNACAAEIVKDLPAAITAGKALIMAFHKAEEKRLLRERTEARQQHLVAIGMEGKLLPEGNSTHADLYINTDNQKITWSQIEGYPDDMWNRLLAEQAEERTALAQTKVKVLEKKLEGASFFGDDEGTEEIKAEIVQAKATPVIPVSYGGGSYSAPATKGLTKTWTFEITDLSQIPREYLQVDEVKVRKAITAGTRAIAGVNIFQKDSISLR